MSGNQAELTQLIQLAGAGDQDAKDSLYRLVHDELRQLARKLVRGRGCGDLDSTALVNEVVLRFEKGEHLRNFANRRVFFSVALQAMNQILINHYHRRRKNVDGGIRAREPLDAVILAMEEKSGSDFEALHQALGCLEKESPRQHLVIMYRFFGGLTITQAAQMLEVSKGTVERDWRLARARLYRMLREVPG